VAIEKQLGSSNREDVKRVGYFSVETGPEPQVFVEWAINDNLTEGLVKSGAQMDIADILDNLAPLLGFPGEDLLDLLGYYGVYFIL